MAIGCWLAGLRHKSASTCLTIAPRTPKREIRSPQRIPEEYGFISVSRFNGLLHPVRMPYCYHSLRPNTVYHSPNSDDRAISKLKADMLCLCTQTLLLSITSSIYKQQPIPLGFTTPATEWRIIQTFYQYFSSSQSGRSLTSPLLQRDSTILLTEQQATVVCQVEGKGHASDVCKAGPDKRYLPPCVRPGGFYTAGNVVRHISSRLRASWDDLV